MNKNDIQASPAQLRYADTLFYGSLIGFVIMLITYVLYVTGTEQQRQHRFCRQHRAVIHLLPGGCAGSDPLFQNGRVQL